MAYKVLCKVIDSLFFPNHDSVVKVIELVSSAKKEEFFSKDPDLVSSVWRVELGVWRGCVRCVRGVTLLF